MNLTYSTLIPKLANSLLWELSKMTYSNVSAEEAKTGGNKKKKKEGFLRLIFYYPCEQEIFTLTYLAIKYSNRLDGLLCFNLTNSCSNFHFTSGFVCKNVHRPTKPISFGQTSVRLHLSFSEKLHHISHSFNHSKC